MHGFDPGLKNLQINNKQVQVSPDYSKMLDGLEFLGDYYDKNYYKFLRSNEKRTEQISVIIDNLPAQMILNW
ncbi:MAG: hypothetical protein U0W24_21405 [Bacteroidales bacterium]